MAAGGGGGVSGVAGAGGWLPSLAAKLYYRHGLFIASNPKLVIFMAILGGLWVCWPLFTLPIYTGEVKVYVESKGTSLRTYHTS